MLYQLTESKCLDQPIHEISTCCCCFTRCEIADLVATSQTGTCLKPLFVLRRLFNDMRHHERPLEKNCKIYQHFDFTCSKSADAHTEDRV